MDNNKSVIVEGLRYALDNQVKWQHYAEAKNLCLLTLSGATLLLLFAPLQNASDAVRFESMLKDLVLHTGLPTTVLTVCVSIALLVSILSFMVKPYKVLEWSDANKLRYISWRYVNIHKTTLETNVSRYTADAQINDLLEQQALGSYITALKYRYFNYGAGMYVVGLLGFVLLSVVW